MHTGSELLETWIPDGGFEITKRKLKTDDGGSAVADCLVPKWPDDELARDLPCARPEPVEIWRKEIQALRTCTELGFHRGPAIRNAGA